MSKPVPEQPEMREISFDESPPRNSVLNKTIENSFPESDLLYSTPNPYSLDRTKSRSALSTQPVNTAYQQWNESNGTYPVSYGLGAIIVSLGIMIALYPIWPQVSAMGSFLLILMALTTLSFLVTTPEAWVPALGDPHHGFPYLSGAGRLVVKDCIMLGAAILTMADAAKTYLRRNSLRL